MISIENVRFVDGDNISINYQINNNITFLDKKDDNIFDILSFNCLKIASGNILINYEPLSIYQDDDKYLYLLKLNETNISFSVVFQLPYDFKDKTISLFKKQLKEIKEKYIKQYDLIKKMDDIFSLINKTKNIKYILFDLNNKNNNLYKDKIFVGLEKNKNIIAIFKSYFVKSDVKVENYVKKDENNLKNKITIKTYFKDNYLYILFNILFSIFISFSSLSCLYLIKDNNLGLGVFLIIISVLFFFFNVSIVDAFYSYFKNKKDNKKVIIYSTLLQILSIIIGFCLGYGVIYLMSHFEIFINLNNYLINDYIYFIVIAILNVILPLLSKPVSIIVSFINKIFKKFLNSFNKN